MASDRADKAHEHSHVSGKHMGGAHGWGTLHNGHDMDLKWHGQEQDGIVLDQHLPRGQARHTSSVRVSALHVHAMDIAVIIQTLPV